MSVQAKTKEFTGWHMLIIMLCFFGVIITVNITMAMFATSSWTGLVVKNTYVESQKFNGYLKEAEKQKALGWSSSLSQKGDAITFSLTDKDGAPLRNLQVAAMAERPTHENEDRKLSFSYISEGQYVHKGRLPYGAWNIKITAETTDKRLYRQNFLIVVKKD